MKSRTLLFAVTLCISGCGESLLLNKPAEVAALTQNQGLIVGSLVLKAKEASPMFPDALLDREWQLVVTTDEHSPSSFRVINIKPDGKEVTFVSIFTPGKYIIADLHTAGWSSRHYKLPLKLNFIVKENKKTYIGRLVISIPSHLNMFKTMFVGDNNITIDIEDAQVDTVALLSGEYGTNLAEGLQKVLIESTALKSHVSTVPNPSKY